MKIAFTSCVRYENFPKQPEWDQISEADPDYLFLLGDTIYMDYGVGAIITKPKYYSRDVFEQTMREKYQNQFECVEPFQQLVNTMRAKNGFYGIWDDHDYAWNNVKGGKLSTSHPWLKAVSLNLFNTYFNCSTNPGKAYYHIDTPMARVIFLDNRSEAEKAGKKSKLISQQQFDFLEEKLEHNLKYTLVCGGLTLTEGHENWKKYDDQLEALCKTLNGKERVLFLGGDIHQNRFVEPTSLGQGKPKTPVQLISSGFQIRYVRKRSIRHNWALLELSEEKAEITFFNKDGKDVELSEVANNYLKEL